MDVQPAPAVPARPEADRGFYEPPADVVADAEPGEIIAARAVRWSNRYSALDEKTWPMWSSIVGDTLASLPGQPIGT